ncbi:uncharacterized protein [Solanum lycopersicum]|uniref:uncharacterized protein isoform X4 n=1 Tax=Solanum lycopersicum TaxID=4081 RepID=UPI0037493847
MPLSVFRFQSYSVSSPLIRCFRSQAALKALAKASEDKVPNLILYNYPSFSGAFAALFTHLYHSHLNLPHLILPFSSVEPFRIATSLILLVQKDLRRSLLGGPHAIGFDHRKSALSKIPLNQSSGGSLTFHVNLEKTSSVAVYEHFSSRLSEVGSNKTDAISLLNSTFQDRVENVLKYIEDGDLHRWSLPDIRAFGIGINQWRSKLNCITNPHMYEQGVRADGDPDLSDEIGKELSKKSASVGLRPIGAVIYLQRKNLKMCLRTVDAATDTSEVAKAYGGGGSPCSSSFIIRMDEYNHWRSVHSS